MERPEEEKAERTGEITMKHIKHVTVAKADSTLSGILTDFKNAIQAAFEALIAELRNIRS